MIFKNSTSVTSVRLLKVLRFGLIKLLSLQRLTDLINKEQEGLEWNVDETRAGQRFSYQI